MKRKIFEKMRRFFNEKYNQKYILSIILIGTIIISIFLVITKEVTDKYIQSKQFLTLDDLNIDLNDSNNYSFTVLSGGCFWCVEKDLEKLTGVKYAISGYTSNNSNDIQPTYNQVASGSTNFRESVLVVYDSKIISFEEIIKYFFTIHDATDNGGSFYDRGFQYTSAIYYNSDDEKMKAEKIIYDLNQKELHNSQIITSVEQFVNFYPAEKYHQDYYKKNPVRYNVYRTSSGREKFVDELQVKAQDLGIDFDSKLKKINF